MKSEPPTVSIELAALYEALAHADLSECDRVLLASVAHGPADVDLAERVRTNALDLLAWLEQYLCVVHGIDLNRVVRPAESSTRRRLLCLPAQPPAPAARRSIWPSAGSPRPGETSGAER
jgi:hypothetical protein